MKTPKPRKKLKAFFGAARYFSDFERTIEANERIIKLSEKKWRFQFERETTSRIEKSNWRNYRYGNLNQ